jgi:flagellar motor switch protein FliN/FliY
MAGEPSIRQEDIEELLQQAQMAAGLAEQSASAAAAAGGTRASRPELVPGAALTPEAAVQIGAPSIAVADPPRPAATRGATGAAIGDDIQLLIAHAQQAIASVDQPANPGIPGLATFQFKDLAGAPASGEKATLELLQDVDLDLRIELGRTRMHLEEVLKLKRGSVVPLDKLAGEPVDVFVNGRMVARGEVLVLNDNFCVRVTELVTGNTFE